MVTSPRSIIHKVQCSAVRDKLFHTQEWRRGARSFCASTSLRRQFDWKPRPNQDSKDDDIQSLYLDTTPPSSDQLAAAKAFFSEHRPTKFWTAKEWRQIQPHSESTFLSPEIAFLGRSNAGKSSLLNAMLGDDSLNWISGKPGKTKVMHAWALSRSMSSPMTSKQGREQSRTVNTDARLTVLDMPGYGFGSHQEWGDMVMKYLTKRRQLRRVFVLINSSHGIKETDWQTFELLRSHGVPHQIIASKCDHIKQMKSNLPSLLSQMQMEIQDRFGTNQSVAGGLLTLRDIIATCCIPKTAKNKNQVIYGIQNLRWAVIRAAGLEEYALSFLSPQRQRTVLPSELQGQDIPTLRTATESNMSSFSQEPKDEVTIKGKI